MGTLRTVIPRRAGGLAMLALLIFVLIGCDSTAIHIGWKSTFHQGINGRTPASFEVACTEIGAVVLEADQNAENPTETRCTMPSGDWMACDWAAKTCVSECTTSEEECDRLSMVGYYPPTLRPKPTPTADDLAGDGWVSGL